MTLLGLAFFLICLFCFFYRPIHYLMGLVIISCIFQAGSIINMGSRGIPPYIFVESFLIVKSIPYLISTKKIKINSVIGCFGIFVFLSIIVTLFMPFIFEGIKITNPGGKTSDEYLALMQLRDHLHFSIKNIIQLLFILFNGLTLYIFYFFRHKLKSDFILKLFHYSILVVLGIGLWGYLNKNYNIPFPNTMFYSNIGYGQLYNIENDLGMFRLNSTFSEPSYCGGFLAASFWGWYKLHNKCDKQCFLILIALALNSSSTGIITFLIGLLLHIITSMKRLIWGLFSFFVLTLILYNSPLWQYIDLVLLNKAETLSGMARINSFLLTLEICKTTYFLGLGWGSHRDFSFIGNTLVAVGLLGTILLLCIIYKMQKNNFLNRKQSKSCLFLFHWGCIHWIAVFIALPDFSYSIIWMWMFASISQYKTIKDANRN